MLMGLKLTVLDEAYQSIDLQQTLTPEEIGDPFGRLSFIRGDAGVWTIFALFRGRRRSEEVH